MATLLAVDDEPYNLLLIEEFLGSDHELVMVGDGLDAWNLLDSDPDRFDAVILDRRMPRMDGMETLRRIRADARYRLVPVIMQTAACEPGDVAEGLSAGAWYYLAKPYKGTALVSIVNSALNDRAGRLEMERLDTDINDVLALTRQARYEFRSPGEARQLAAMCSRLHVGNVGVGMGLAELMLNAIEHGNLGITYAEKSELLAADRWQEEVARRLVAKEFGDRHAELEFTREGDHVRFTIRDEGAGFDWRNYLEMDPARAFDSHGRGIALARQLAFASLEYQGIGNVVTATLHLSEES
jgi:CheY-like chemotaxis protein/anti-sigma regulatory factor (Ser/Thr protein kinase)